MKLAPIALFVYNRPRHTRQIISALAENEFANQSILYVYADGLKENSSESDRVNIRETRTIAESIQGFGEVKLRFADRNKGLANSIIEGVTEVVNGHDKVIVLEDDIVVSPYFLTYMNDGLNIYEKKEEVICIHAYNYPIENTGLPQTFFMRGADCWGWATWKRGWDVFEHDSKRLNDNLHKKRLIHDFDRGGTYPFSTMLKDQMEGKIDSWAIRWYASAFLKNKYTLYPKVSLINNIGFDNSGTHSGNSDNFNNPNWNNHSRVEIDSSEKVKTNKLALQRWQKYFHTIHRPFTNKKRFRLNPFGHLKAMYRILDGKTPTK